MNQPKPYSPQADPYPSKTRIVATKRKQRKVAKKGASYAALRKTFRESLAEQPNATPRPG